MCRRITTELAEKPVLFVVAGCSAQQLADKTDGELHCCLMVEMGVGVLVRSVCCIEGELCLLELQVVLSLAH